MRCQFHKTDVQGDVFAFVTFPGFHFIDCHLIGNNYLQDPYFISHKKKDTYLKVPSRVSKQVVKVSSHFDSFVSDEKSLLINVWLTRAY